MPIYVYKCKEHGRFETWQSMASRGSCECPNCGSICQRDHSAETGGLDPFKPYWADAISANPLFIDSRSKEKKVSKELGFERIS